jgi:glycosyltransferase involved in cell wall biosynthesis
MRPSTILFVSNSSRGDGAEVCLFRLLATIDREKFRPIVVMPGGGRMVAKAKELGISVYERPVDWWIRADPKFQMSRLDLETVIRSITEVIDRERPALIHTNTSVILAGALAARRSGVPHVWHLHEVLKGHTDLRSVLPLDDVYKIIGELSDRVVTVARAQLKECSSIDPSRLRTIPNGVQPNVVDRDAAMSVRRQLGLDEGTLVIASVGAVILRKGYEDLIDAATIVRDAGVDAHYLIVGRGDEDALARLRARVAERGVGDRVHLLGFRADVPAVLAASDILAHPSRNEALPTAILEAMAASLPSVATDCGGTSELVVDGVTGVIVPVQDPDQLAGAIVRLAGDPGLRRRMGELGRKRFNEHFSLGAMTRAFEELYRDVIREAAGAPPRPIDPSVERLIRIYQRTYRRRRAFARIGEMAARPFGRARRT